MQNLEERIVYHSPLTVIICNNMRRHFALIVVEYLIYNCICDVVIDGNLKGCIC